MGEGVDEDNGLEIYKFRRYNYKDKNDLLLRMISLGNVQEKHNNTLDPLEEISRCKNYAILQKPPSKSSNEKFRYAIEIYSSSAWRLFILVTLVASYLLDTWIFTFFEPSKRPFWVITFIILLNIIFAMDVVAVASLKCFKKWRKTLNIEEPATSTVIIDILLAIPYAISYFVVADEYSYYINLSAPLAATLRIYRVVYYFYNRSSRAGSNQWTSFLIQYLTLFLISFHSWSCIWYLFSYRNFDILNTKTSWSNSAIFLPTETILDWYLVCAYWSVMCITTNALGDLYPVNLSERISATLSILVGFLLTTIVFVGSLTSQFITLSTRRSKYVSRLRKIENHLRLIQMDTTTKRQIIRYYEDLWYQKAGVFKPKMMNLLPYPLQMEICFDINATPLYSSLIFRKLPEPFLRRLSLAMTHQFYLPGDIVYNNNENKTFMVCVTKGVLELLSDEDDDSAMISFTRGTCFGEISVVYNIPARCTVKAATYVECQVLDKAEYIRLIIMFPDIADLIRQEINERIERSRKMKLIHDNDTPLSLNIYASANSKKSSIKCLKDKLRYLQGLYDFAIGKTEEDLSPEDRLDTHCLNLYILSEHVKKKRIPFTCTQNKFPWILEWDCYLTKYWEIYMLGVVFYVSLTYPYFIGFLREFPGGIFFNVDIIINISLIFNVIMSTVTAIKTKEKYIRSFVRILRYRLNTLGFYMDIMAMMPFENLVDIHRTAIYHDDYRVHMFYLCKGSKLCLVWRISHFFEKLESKLLINIISLKVAKYSVYVTLLCYWFGVILYMESCFISRCTENSWFSKPLMWDKVPSNKTEYPFVTSVYFATTILLSIGQGDFTPGDSVDMILIAFLSLYGVLLVGYFVAEFSAVITHWSRNKTAFLEVIYTIDNFMKEHNMHRAIVSRIMAIYDLQWQYNSGVELTGNSWLKKTVIPSELRKKVLHQARFKTLTSIKLFRVKNNAFIHKVTEMAKDLILPPGEIVYYGGTISRELYIIESGYCLVTCTSGKISKEWIVGPGKDLGLLSLLYGVAAPRTIITLTHCKLISISYSSYNSALSLFPEMKEHDGLLTHEELQVLETKEVTQNTEAYLKHYTHIINKKAPKGFEINNVSKMLFNNSFINVRHYYARNKKNYHQSFKKFGAFKTVASYLLMPIVIKPDGYFIKIWAILRVCAAFVLCLLIPVIVSMPPFTEMFQIPTIISEVICYIDIYIMLHVGYYGNKNLLIYHPYLTAKKYLQGSFFADFIASFPWYILWRLIATKTGTPDFEKILSRHLFHTSVRMTNILQIYKLYAVFWTDSVSALKRAYIMSVLQFLLLTLFFLNLYSSILISLTCKCIVATDEETFAIRIAKMSTEKAYIKATFSPEGNIICQQGSWIDKTEFLRGKNLTPRRVYLLALYWSATSFTGAGFGDIIPQDTTHMILCICIVVHGVFFFGFVYARIASLKAVADQVMTKFQENLKQLELFMTREKVPLSLKKTVNEYWKYQWKRTGGWSHQSILGKLHTNLNEDAVLYLYEKTLQEIPLFENVEYSFFRALAKKLNEQYFQKGYMVMRANEVISKIYIIYRGKVDIVSDTNEVEVCMGPGGIFGNIRGPSKYLTMSNVIASRNIDVLSIKGTDFYALMKSYPAVLRKVRYCVSKAPKDYVMPTVLHEDYLCPGTYETGDNEDENDKNDTEPTSYFESPEKSIAGSHGSKSSIGNNIHYTSATYLLLLPHRWFRKSVVPDCFWVSFIDYLILFLSYVDFMVLVYQMAFMSIDNFFYICVATDVIFIYKLFLDIHTGFMNRYGDYVLTPKKVRKMYFSKVLQRRRDFLANFLVCYIAFALNLSPGAKMGFFCYLRTPQLFRITYLFKYQIDGKINMGSGNLLLKLTTIGIWASIISHVNACLFFKLSCLTHVHCNSSNWLSKKELNLQDRYAEGDYISLYVTALWYIVNLLTITGTGDVCSQNAFEYIETIILLIVIKFSTGLLISEMSAMITAHSSSRIEYDYGINKLRDGLRGMKLSDHQMNKMWDYVRELWNRQQGRQMPELVYFLPFRLRCQVMQAVYGSHIRDSIIFRKTNDDFKRMLSVWLKHCVFFPGNYIVQSGSSDQCIYFIHRGEVEVLTVHANLTESVYDILGPEESFGIAQGIFVGVVHHFSFRARTVVDIVYLKLDEWKYLLDFYPKSAKIIRKKVENVYLIEY